MLHDVFDETRGAETRLREAGAIEPDAVVRTTEALAASIAAKGDPRAVIPTAQTLAGLRRTFAREGGSLEASVRAGAASLLLRRQANALGLVAEVLGAAARAAEAEGATTSSIMAAAGNALRGELLEAGEIAEPRLVSAAVVHLPALAVSLAVAAPEERAAMLGELRRWAMDVQNGAAASLECAARIARLRLDGSADRWASFHAQVRDENGERRH